MGKKLTKNERNWILYDVGNSAFTLLIATILPIYFNYLAGNAGISSVDYLAYWGYAASVGTILVALAGPVLGTMADTKGFKKPIFTGAILVCMGIYRKLCTVCNLSSGCVKCREDWDYNGDSNDGFLCDHHGMVGNYDITTSENLSPEVLCRKEAACFFRKLQKNRHYSEKCKEGEEGFSVSSGVFLLY